MNRRQLFAAFGAVALAPGELWRPPQDWRSLCKLYSGQTVQEETAA